MNQVIDMEVVEEALDVKEEKARDVSCLYARLDGVDHAQDRVRSHVVVL